MKKIYMTTCVITLWPIQVMLLTTSVSTVPFLLEINLKAVGSQLKGHIINRILHSWSFHKFHMK